MVGITSYGAYIPIHRVTPETEGWDAPYEKATAHFDEDSITMAVAAAIDCLREGKREDIDGLYFASTTSPYKEKLAATTVAIAADLRSEILTSDCTNSLRAGTTAVKMALDAVKAGSARQMLVTAADCRMGYPRGTFDRNFGDGAAALLIGEENVIATIEATYSVSDEILDVWRMDTNKYVHAWEDRWVADMGYNRVVPLAAREILKKSNLTIADISKVVFYGQDQRKHAQMAKMLGLKPEQVQNPMFGTVGNTGAAFSLMMLVATLEEAAAGDRILCVSYGNGADAFLLEVTDAIAAVKGRRTIKQNLGTKMVVSSYEKYLSYRHMSAGEDEGNYTSIPEWPSASCIFRERDAIYRLHGGKCNVCGTVQYPPQRICTKCRSVDNFSSLRLSDKKAKLFTYSIDSIAEAPAYALPLVDCIIDFEGGGRANFTMTDVNPKDVKVGMTVEMSFRKIATAGNIHNYAWKCVPFRGVSREETK
jgi:hydroxymethylglutaryl-CoA synthase